jgi:hypothetical protein
MNPNKYKTKFQGASTLHKNSKTRLSSRTSLRFLFLAAGILALLVSGWSMFAAPAPPSNAAISLDQASNGGIGKTPISPVGWENGNQNGQKAHYNEGDSIPYRARVTGLTSGQIYRATFGYDITHSGKHAIDYITSNNRIAETVDPCDGTGEPAISPCAPGLGGVIPAPAGGTALKDIAHNSFLSLSQPQLVSIFNGDISEVVFMTEGDPSLAQSETTFRVTFTASSSQVILSWGGHIARQFDWSDGNAANGLESASGIPGSPFHTRAKAIEVPNGSGGFNVVSIGNQDRALASSAVQPPSACLLSGDGDRLCGSGSKVHSFSGTVDTSSTYSFSILGTTGSTTASINAIGTNTNPNSPPIQATVDSSGTGTYTIRLTVSNAAGSETCDATVTVDQAPVAVDVANQDRCDSGAPADKVFTVDSAGSTIPVGGSLTWSIQSGTATIGDGSVAATHAASTTVTLSGSGSVTVRLTIAGPAGTSCTSSFDDAVLTLNSSPTVSIALENECNAGTADLKATASGGTGTIHYQWKKDGVNTGADSDTLAVTALGTYSVTVTDGKTCTGSATKKLCFSLQNAP